jgi:hypothetical protein
VSLTLKGKRSESKFIRAYELYLLEPETKWSNHDQADVTLTSNEGLNSYMSQNIEMSCGLEWKANQT